MLSYIFICVSNTFETTYFYVFMIGYYKIEYYQKLLFHVILYFIFKMHNSRFCWRLKIKNKKVIEILNTIHFK